MRGIARFPYANFQQETTRAQPARTRRLRAMGPCLQGSSCFTFRFSRPSRFPLAEYAAHGSPNHAKAAFLAEYAAEGSLSRINRRANRVSIKARLQIALLPKGKPQVAKAREANNPDLPEKKRLTTAPKAHGAPRRAPCAAYPVKKALKPPHSRPLRGIFRQGTKPVKRP